MTTIDKLKINKLSNYLHNNQIRGWPKPKLRTAFHVWVTRIWAPKLIRVIKKIVKQIEILSSSPLTHCNNLCNQNQQKSRQILNLCLHLSSLLDIYFPCSSLTNISNEPIVSFCQPLQIQVRSHKIYNSWVTFFRNLNDSKYLCQRMNPPDFSEGRAENLKWYIFWGLSFFEILGGAIF